MYFCIKESKTKKHYIFTIKKGNKQKHLVKKLKDIKYSKNKNKYVCTINEDNNKILKMMNYIIPDLKLNLKREPYFFQKQVIKKIDSFKGRCLLALDMGTGKTNISLAYTQLHKKDFPVLIICPASVIYNWEKEIKMTVPGNPRIIILDNSVPKNFFIRSYDFVIINYDIFPNTYEKVQFGKRTKHIEILKTGWVDFLCAKGFKVCIVDEAHYIKNNTTARTKSIQKFCRNIPKILFLTGTPIENNVMDIFNAIQLLRKNIFPKRSVYAKRYCYPEHNGYTIVYKKSRNEKELNKILTNNLMIRLKKEEVLDQLPKLNIEVIPMKINNLKEYKEVMKDFIGYLQKNPHMGDYQKALKAHDVTKLAMLLRLSNIGKIQAVTQWIEDYIATGKKLVVFCTFVKDVLNPLYKKFEKISVRLAGDTNKKKRQEYVDKFDKDPNCKIFFAQLKAGGVGLNLVAADTTLHCGLAYNPQLHDQARDRVNRIGQKSSNVNMYYAIAKDTAEEPLIDILDEKRAISDKVIDGEENMVSISVRDELRKRVLGEGRYPLFT